MIHQNKVVNQMIRENSLILHKFRHVNSAYRKLLLDPLMFQSNLVLIFIAQPFICNVLHSGKGMLTVQRKFFVYSRNPLIGTLVFRVANYPDRLGPSCTFGREF
jgi:hypothetical protein